MTTIDNYCKYGAKPASAFVIGAAASQVFAPKVANMDVMIAGMTVPVWMFSGLSCAVGNIIGQLVTEVVAPHITTLTLLSAPAHTAVNIGLSAGGSAIAFNTLVGEGWNNGVSVPGLFAIATASEVGSSYLTETWIRPALNTYMN